MNGRFYKDAEIPQKLSNSKSLAFLCEIPHFKFETGLRIVLFHASERNN